MQRGITDTRSDDQLLRDHTNGDRTAFEVLFKRHENKLWAVALRTTGDYDDAADSLQDALESVNKTAGRFRFDCTVSSWLYRVVLNASLDRLRRNKSHASTPLIEEDESLADPLDHTGDIDLSLSIGRALDVLPPEQRAVIILLHIYDLSVADASEALGVPPGTVKSRANRGRAKLALVLGHLRTQS
ncbi:RNA polymerase sigma factor SigM [Gordonia sp. HY285]|uniref:RNA polymerase sigma factor SigM n=1 Tax=Gordonia liuliyuniae TaxID=2911517 RepID=UPI001F005371|nr:RNA polymerase sigma factor SigM [Gordonia liuliyuniae]MCF8609064.1 RNA polymerase sigma factor SigM [Gordonia liuliyuniae]